MVVDAGFVPCAESGTRIRFLREFPRAACHARIMRMPVSSPCAPAEGWRLTLWNPPISAIMPCRPKSSAIAPCAVDGSCKGCSRAKPGSRATASLTFGLYFIVQDPRGYKPSSTQ
jgi:hypothetical protein